MIVMIMKDSLLIIMFTLVLIDISICQENSLNPSVVSESIVISNNNSISTSSDPPNLTKVGLKLIVDGLVAPMEYISSGDLTGRMFVVDQIGTVQTVAPGGKLLNDTFLDLRDRLVSLSEGYDERGLLGLAFHPKIH